MQLLVLNFFRSQTCNFRRVIPEIDIWRAANLMLKRYGDKALEESTARADELAAQDDHNGAQCGPQHLAALRRLFDWLIVGQVVDQNPAAPVRGPSHIVKKGKTPVLDGDEARKLIDSIDVSTIVGLRDRALIGLLIYSFARISAALQMNVDDYYPQGKCWWVRLHEKAASSTRCRRIICSSIISTTL
jgi:site-specific recombinase XerC